VEEIYQIRAQLLPQHGGDFFAYFAALLKKQREYPELDASSTQATSPQQSESKRFMPPTVFQSWLAARSETADLCFSSSTLYFASSLDFGGYRTLGVPHDE
jgi:hypothetical protein